MTLLIIAVLIVLFLTGLRIAQEYQRGEASRKLGDAAEQMANNPVAVELRRMQMVTEVGAENNSTTVLMIPSDFVTLARSLAQYLSEHAPRGGPPPGR
jgi:hypothetical protein